MMCYGQTNSGTRCQEFYETRSRDAGRRARALRRLGYEAHSGSMGMQVTGVGRVRMTLVNILPGTNADTFGLPAVEIERL